MAAWVATDVTNATTSPAGQPLPYRNLYAEHLALLQVDDAPEPRWVHVVMRNTPGVVESAFAAGSPLGVLSPPLEAIFASTNQAMVDRITAIGRKLSLSLALAGQTGGITRENAAGLLQSVGISEKPVKIHLLAGWVGSMTPSVIVAMQGDQALRDAVMSDTWCFYRLQASSTPGLVGNVLEGLPVAMVQRLNPAGNWLTTITAARDAPWSLQLAKQIPAAALVTAYAYMKVTNTLPGDTGKRGGGENIWFQGQRAWDAASPAGRSKLMAFFEEYVRLTNVGFTGKTDINALITAWN